MPMQLFVGPYADSGMNRTVSGCAIMVLVGAGDGSRGPIVRDRCGAARGVAPIVAGAGRRLVAASTATDRSTSASLTPAGAVRLTDRLGVALAAEAGGVVRVVPICSRRSTAVRGGAPEPATACRRSSPGCRRPRSGRSASTRRTSRSSSASGRSSSGSGASDPGRRARRSCSRISTRTASTGSRRRSGSLAWRSPSGVELVVAQGDAYLPDARDGWEWVSRALRRPSDAAVGRELGELVAGAASSAGDAIPVISEPVESAGRGRDRRLADARRWRRSTRRSR